MNSGFPPELLTYKSNRKIFITKFISKALNGPVKIKLTSPVILMIGAAIAPQKTKKSIATKQLRYPLFNFLT